MNDLSNKSPIDRPQRVRQAKTVRGNRSFFFPILLIALGIIFLLRNMNALPGDAWDLVLRMWPLILIVMGLDSIFTRQGVAAPTIFIAIGTVILLSNLNAVQWDIWQVILNLWPVLIVAIGLDLLVARRSLWGAILSLLLLAAILGGSLWVMAARSTIGSQGQGEQVVQVLNSAERVIVQVDPAVAALNIHALTEPGSETLVQGIVQTSTIGTLKQEYRVEDGVGFLNLYREGTSVDSPTLRGSDWTWNLAFHPQIPLEMQVNLGVGSMDLDLSALQLTDLNIQMGVGKTVVTLPDPGGSLAVNIQGGIGEMIVYIPSHVSVRLNSDTGLAMISVPDGFSQDGDEYTFTSPGGDPGNLFELNVSQAIGRIVIRYRQSEG